MRDDARQRATEFLNELYAACGIDAGRFETNVTGPAHQLLLMSSYAQAPPYAAGARWGHEHITASAPHH
jgi:hypothetical protein